jgi:hypothetical protein
MHRSRVRTLAWSWPALLGMVASCAAHKPPAAALATPQASASLPSRHRPDIELTAVLTGSTKATIKLSSQLSACHSLFTVAGSDAAAEVSRLAALCVEVTKMQRAYGPFTGAQAAADTPQTYKWKGRAGHCYRAYGVGVNGIKNLDLLLEDSTGEALGQDLDNGPAPVVLDTGTICFKVDDEADVVVSVGDGKGSYAVEIWGD